MGNYCFNRKERINNIIGDTTKICINVTWQKVLKMKIPTKTEILERNKNKTETQYRNYDNKKLTYSYNMSGKSKSTMVK